MLHNPLNPQIKEPLVIILEGLKVILVDLVEPLDLLLGQRAVLGPYKVLALPITVLHDVQVGVIHRRDVQDLKDALCVLSVGLQFANQIKSGNL